MNKKLMTLMIVFSSGCSNTAVEKDGGPVSVPVDVLAIADAVPKYEKRTRAGNPDEYEINGKRYKVLAKSSGYKKAGVASWYGTKFHGRKTSNGEIYNMYAMTAAHKTLPIPSYVRVTHLKNKQSVVVRINDRGPFHEDRIIDLSYTAAAKLGLDKTGTGLVEVQALGFDSAKKVEQKIIQLGEEDISQTPIFYLQVGAFAQSGNATHLQGKLTMAEIDSIRIKHNQKQGNNLYKVQVGPLYSEQQAKQENEKLTRIGFPNAVLIVEEN